MAPTKKLKVAAPAALAVGKAEDREGTKRPSGALRKEHQEKQAQLVQFILPALDHSGANHQVRWERDGVPATDVGPANVESAEGVLHEVGLASLLTQLHNTVPGGLPTSPNTSASLLNTPELRKTVSEWRTQYQTMQRKGWRITRDTGCCFAHPQYQGSAGEGRVRAHASVFRTFHGFKPAAEPVPAAAEEAAEALPVQDNPTGRAEQLTLSHYCKRGHIHMRCANRRHIGVEPLWRNQLRNYCFWVEDGANPGDWPGDCGCCRMLRAQSTSLAHSNPLESQRLLAVVGTPCLLPYMSWVRQNADADRLVFLTSRAAVEAMLASGVGGSYTQAPDGTAVDNVGHAVKWSWADVAALEKRDAAATKRKQLKQPTKPEEDAIRADPLDASAAEADF